jgi:hypothetical protein
MPHGKQRATNSAGESFASELKGGSHPGGSAALIAGATGVIKSPFRDRSTLLACDTNSDWAMSPDWDGAARGDIMQFIARIITGTAEYRTIVHFTLSRHEQSLRGRLVNLASVIVSMTHPPMVNAMTSKRN